MLWLVMLGCGWLWLVMLGCGWLWLVVMLGGEKKGSTDGEREREENPNRLGLGLFCCLFFWFIMKIHRTVLFVVPTFL